jgi:hypothetical protein
MRMLVGIFMSIARSAGNWRRLRAHIPGWGGKAARRVGGSDADLRLRRRCRLERVGLLAVERSQDGTAPDEADRNAENVPLTNLIAQTFGHRLSLRSPSEAIARCADAPVPVSSRDIDRTALPGLAFIAFESGALIDIDQM